MNNLFDVNKVPLVALPEDAPIEVVEYFANNPQLNTPSYGTFRDDDYGYLGTVGRSYDILQNSDMYGFVRKAAEICGLNDEEINFISLQGGRRVSFQVQLPEWAIGDTGPVRRYLSAITSHDGSTSTGIGNTGVRVWCSNTWFMAYKACRKFRHTINGNAAAMALADDMLEAINVEKQLKELFEELNRKPFPVADAEDFTKDLLQYTSKDLVESARKQAKYNRFMEGLEHELVEVGETAWGAFNGVTYTTNHIIRRNDQADYLMFKDGHKINQRAFEILT